MAKKIKIAILSRYTNVNFRGVESVVEALKNSLNKIDGFEVAVLSGKDSDNWSGVRDEFDVVIPTNGRWQALKMCWGRWFGKYKVIIVGHSGPGIDDIWNLVVARPNVFVVLTNSTNANWRMRLGRLLAFGVQVVQIPNGVDLIKFNQYGETAAIDLPKPIILSVGALVPEKRHRLVINAVSKMNGSLVIIGDGPERDELVRIGKEKLGNRFLLQKVTHDKIASFYRAVDLFTLPSWGREAFGVVYLEAMATNLPIVAPDDESRREIIGNAGIYVQVEDETLYANGIEKALKDNWEDRPRRQAERFGWDLVAGQYARLISSLVREK